MLQFQNVFLFWIGMKTHKKHFKKCLVWDDWNISFQLGLDFKINIKQTSNEVILKQTPNMFCSNKESLVLICFFKTKSFVTIDTFPWNLLILPWCHFLTGKYSPEKFSTTSSSQNNLLKHFQDPVRTYHLFCGRGNDTSGLTVLQIRTDSDAFILTLNVCTFFTGGLGGLLITVMNTGEMPKSIRNNELQQIYVFSCTFNTYFQFNKAW